MPGSLVYESAAKEYVFPDLKQCFEIKCEENLFDNIGSNHDGNELDLKQLESLTEEVDMLKCKLHSKD